MYAVVVDSVVVVNLWIDICFRMSYWSRSILPRSLYSNHSSSSVSIYWYGYYSTQHNSPGAVFEEIELPQAGFRTYNPVLDRCSTNSDTEAAQPNHALYRAHLIEQLLFPFFRVKAIGPMNCATGNL